MYFGFFGPYFLEESSPKIVKFKPQASHTVESKITIQNEIRHRLLFSKELRAYVSRLASGRSIPKTPQGLSPRRGLHWEHV